MWLWMALTVVHTKARILLLGVCDYSHCFALHVWHAASSGDQQRGSNILSPFSAAAAHEGGASTAIEGGSSVTRLRCVLLYAALEAAAVCTLQEQADNKSDASARQRALSVGVFRVAEEFGAAASMPPSTVHLTLSLWLLDHAADGSDEGGDDMAQWALQWAVRVLLHHGAGHDLAQAPGGLGAAALRRMLRFGNSGEALAFLRVALPVDATAGGARHAAATSATTHWQLQRGIAAIQRSARNLVVVHNAVSWALGGVLCLWWFS